MPCLHRTFDPSVGPIISVFAWPAGQRPAGNLDPTPATYPLLVDTGASSTALTKDVLDAIGAKPVGITDVITPTGLGQAAFYVLDVAIPFVYPNGSGISQGKDGVTVIEYNGDTRNYQGLLGRDVLCSGSLIRANNSLTFCL